MLDGISESTADVIETSIHRDRSLGDAKWIMKAAKEMSLESSLRHPGRPKKEAKQRDEKDNLV